MAPGASDARTLFLAAYSLRQSFAFAVSSEILLFLTVCVLLVLTGVYPPYILLIMHYVVIDLQTGATVGIYRTRARARRVADRMDLAYGAIRYSVREI